MWEDAAEERRAIFDNFQSATVQ